MDVGETSPIRAGLRERKKQQTRETIARVALELFAEHGFEQTTLADIADAANVSKRTIFAYFDSKEDILFCDGPAILELLKQTLEQRPPGATTVDALRDFVSSMSSMASADETAMLRKKILLSDEGLRRSQRARFAQMEQLIEESVARDLNASPGDVRPPIVAASITAALTTLSDRLEAQTGEPITHEQGRAAFDEVLEFLRGGLEGLRRA
jgi:AcrR family transcriptional regulator